MNTELLIFEGSRGTGKSTITHQLRQMLKDTTLINFTGFNTDGDEGLQRISSYYASWLAMFKTMNQLDIDQRIICDRIFFSEMVFSKLYKSYDFEPVYNIFLDKLEDLNPTIFYFTINDEEELSRRLQRDKIPFYKVEESVKETMRQQEEYDKVFKAIDNKFNIVTIDTSYLTAEQVKDIVLSKL